LHFDFGTSIIDGQEVIKKINSSLKWTLLYILIAFFLTFGMAIPLGIYMASHSGSKLTKFLDWKLLGFHSVPIFWLTTLAVIFLTSSEITEIFNIFPSIGLGNIDEDMSLFTQIKIAFPHLILPSLVIALHSGAYLTTLIKRNMLKEMDEKYFLAILSRGTKRKTTILKHIFPNSILPLITLMVVSLPASLAGSVVTEVIFNIPGMGRLLYNSILTYDWNVVFAIVLLIGIATYISYVIGDILYVYFNPKVKIS
jgi:peptide/nickel transport system permease protein